MLHILVHNDISMKFWYCISATFVCVFFGFAAYPWHHVIILVQMTQLMLNIYITQISVVGDRQLKYSAFIPILPWSANAYILYIMCQSIPLELYYCASFLPAHTVFAMQCLYMPH